MMNISNIDTKRLENSLKHNRKLLREIESSGIRELFNSEQVYQACDLIENELLKRHNQLN